MRLIRPEARAALRRWREAGIGAAAALLSAWWAASSYGLVRWAAVLATLAALGFVAAGLLRALRPRGGTGAGVVVIDERQVTYLSGPGGGMVSLDRLARVEVEGQGPGRAPLWHLADADGNRVSVPADALGAERLYDALSALPGLGSGALIRAARREEGRAALWHAGPRRIG